MAERLSRAEYNKGRTQRLRPPGCGAPDPVNNHNMKPERAALPTTLQISQTQTAITSYQNSLQSIATRLSSTQAHLDRVTRENKHILETLQNEKHDLELKIAQARSYLAPIRRLPTELLGVVFTRAAHTDPIAPWTISAVCRLWREQILSMSNLWSTIRLKTSIAMAPDTIRLWLERSGTISPLDIEIRLRVSVNTIEVSPHPQLSASNQYTHFQCLDCSVAWLC